MSTHIPMKSVPLPQSDLRRAKRLLGFDYGSSLYHVLAFDFGTDGGAIGIWCEGDNFCARVTLDALAEFHATAKAMRAQADAEALGSTTSNSAIDIPRPSGDLMECLTRFADVCADSTADGHCESKEDMRALAEIGAVRTTSFGRSYLTDFGRYLLASVATTESVRSTQVPADHASDFDKDAATRLRGILVKIGVAVPESNEELMACLFSYLGYIRRAFDRLYAQTPGGVCATPEVNRSPMTKEDVERQYKDGIHIGSGLPRATCPCGFCAKHRNGFDQGEASVPGSTYLRALIAQDSHAAAFQTIGDYREALLRCSHPVEFYDDETPHWYCDIPSFPTLETTMWRGVEVADWIEANIKPAFDRLTAQLEAVRPASLKAIDGDVLPPIGSDVLIHLASIDKWMPHTVVGYYVWPSLDGNSRLQRVFVRVRDVEGTQNARMLCDVQRLDGSPFVLTSGRA
jgi:hypothetical protein